MYPHPKVTNKKVAEEGIKNGTRRDFPTLTNCGNKSCTKTSVRYGLYAKNTPKGICWVCRSCAMKVDKII